MGGAVASNASPRTASQAQPLSSAMSVGYSSPPRNTNAMTNTVVSRQQQGVEIYDTGRSPAMPQSMSPPQQQQEPSPALRLLMSDTDLDDEDQAGTRGQGYGNSMYQGQPQQPQRQNQMQLPPMQHQYHQPQPQRANEAMQMDQHQMQRQYGPVNNGPQQAQVQAPLLPQGPQARMPQDFGNSAARGYETRQMPRVGPPFDSNVLPRPMTSHGPNDTKLEHGITGYPSSPRNAPHYANNEAPTMNGNSRLVPSSNMSHLQQSQRPQQPPQGQNQTRQQSASSPPQYLRVDPNPSSLGYYAQSANSPTSPGGYQTFAA